VQVVREGTKRRFIPSTETVHSESQPGGITASTRSAVAGFAFDKVHTPVGEIGDLVHIPPPEVPPLDVAPLLLLAPPSGLPLELLAPSDEHAKTIKPKTGTKRSEIFMGLLVQELGRVQARRNASI
jgi:hypothetical protein